MSVQDLNRVHRRYIKISNGFKSAWTFHQFIQGLRKVFVDEGPEAYQADFQSVYGDLKAVSQNLSEVTVDSASDQLDAVEKGLVPLVQALLSADEQISPALLRQFFQRVKNYDDNILSQLVKFYLYFREPGGWNWDRLDKADYLTTKSCEEFQDGQGIFTLRDRTHVREMGQGFWAALGTEGISEVEIAALIEEIEGARREVGAVESIDELNSKKVVQRFRDFKHGLGDTFFHPKVLQSVVETNLAIKNHVEQLYRREEQRIVAEYQEVFELEREVQVDVDLKEELTEFRQAVERFEGQLQGQNVRLEELSGLRDQVRQLIPKLKPESEELGPMVVPAEIRELKDSRVGKPPEPLEEWTTRQYQAMIDALEEASPAMEPKKVVILPDVFSFSLEPREVVAYRRIYSGAQGNRDVERFLLRAAALRSRIADDIEEIKGILDDTAVTRDAPIFGQARQTVRFSDQAVRNFEHLVAQAVVEGDANEARALEVLRMRLVREHANLWLRVFKD